MIQPELYHSKIVEAALFTHYKELIVMRATQTLTAVIHQEESWYVAECPEVGTASQGKTLEEAVANLKEATELYIDCQSA